MNQELEKDTLWLAANKLSLKVGKANFMIFKSKNRKVQHKVPVNIADQNMTVDHTKFLGVYIDENFVGNFISVVCFKNGRNNSKKQDIT